MIKLNKNISVGMSVTIPRGLSWQVNEAAGEYSIVGISSDYYTLAGKNGKIVTVDAIGLEYLLGERVSFKYGVTYRTRDDFYPETQDPEFITDDCGGLGFWYLGYRGGNEHISFSPGDYSKFFYIKYPEDFKG